MKAGALLLVAALLPLPALAASPKTESEHVVLPGETLNGVANRAGVSSKAIIEANGLKEPYTLRAGRKLTIPRAGAGKSTAPKAAPAKPEARPATPKPGSAKAVTAKPAPAKTSATKPATAQASAPSRLEQETSHVVAEGETLSSIAAGAKVPRVLIAEANGLKPPYTVRVGQKLLLPRTRHHVVKAGETGFAIAYKYAVPWSQVAVANGLDPDAPVKVGQNLLIPTLLDPPPLTPAFANAAANAAASAAAPAGTAAARFAWPVEGTVKRGWRARSAADYHDGLDIAAPRGTTVRAAAPGTVVFAGNEKEQFGNLVVLDHGDGWNTAYGFLSRITVKKGARVAAGERVGLVGDTGKARGDELHFEVRQNGAPVDPQPELPKAP